MICVLLTVMLLLLVSMMSADAFTRGVKGDNQRHYVVEKEARRRDLLQKIMGVAC